ncbi:alanine racemase [Aquibium carbonis]|uniref:Alanine racemase n=2 Tax=Aquibium carbonis TaxID=2495581 RepID=A0A429YWW6_9HYPH|nr:alanine racemase [Aquibium carbonis]
MVDLRALRSNYRALAKVVGRARVAGIVKADAYGLGIAQVVPALTAEGCDTFFVATADEGMATRRAAPDARIFVLNSLFSEDAAALFASQRLTPVLNGATDIALWERHCAKPGTDKSCAIQVDTGLNRLGLTVPQAIAYAADNALTRAIEPVLLMSHLACGDERDHPLNRKQLAAFNAVRAAFPGVAASLANSSGLLLGREFHLDLVRPGIAVYGGAPSSSVTMKTVVTAEARILQVRRAQAGDVVSYGATQVLERDSLIAIAAVGYADGLLRSSSGSGVPMRALRPGGFGAIRGQRVPILGRVTMDLTMFDVTDLGPDTVLPGNFIQLFGPDLPIDEAASAAGTIAYELLTGLSRRYTRFHVGIDEATGA